MEIMEQNNNFDYDFPFSEEGIIQLDNQYSHKKFKNYLSNDVVDRAMGCLFGSFIGDALGAYLQFAKEKDFNKMLQNVMKMPGEGIFMLKPGQVTDDSQLAFHLLKALKDGFKPDQKFSQLANQIILNIGKQYISWGKSRPFDVGITCRKGIKAIQKVLTQNKIDLLPSNKYLSPQMADEISRYIHKQVYQATSQSQSNGSLMRIAPMPFFFSIINKDQGQYLNSKMQLTRQIMKTFIKDQTSLLHSNKVNVEVSYRWVALNIAIIKRKHRNDLKPIYLSTKQMLQSEYIGWGKFTQQKDINARSNIGWAKIAVSLGLKSLQGIIDNNSLFNENLYIKQIQKVLSKGGDTDTNAAIVGGLLGSLIGFKNLPKKYLSKMMDLRHDGDHKRKRPQFYEPRMAYVNAFRIIEKYLNTE